jgi:hypothetical protein
MVHQTSHAVPQFTMNISIYDIFMSKPTLHPLHSLPSDPAEEMLELMKSMSISTTRPSTFDSDTSVISSSPKRHVKRKNPVVQEAALEDLKRNIEHHAKYNPLKPGYVPYRSARTTSKRHRTTGSPLHKGGKRRKRRSSRRLATRHATR